MNIKHIETNIRHHSRPGAYPWHILTAARDNAPLMVCPPGHTIHPAIWYKASLFTPDRVAAVAAIASEQLGEPVRAVPIVEYLDGLRDKLVREERARAREVIHA